MSTKKKTNPAPKKPATPEEQAVVLRSRGLSIKAIAQKLHKSDRWVSAILRPGAQKQQPGMTFGQAIDACRYRGAKIQRVNWNGEGQFVRFEEVLASEDGKLHYNPQDVPGMAASGCFVFHFVNRKTGKTGIQVGWLASQADLKANDWRIVD